MKLNIESTVHDLGYSVITEFVAICNAITESKNEDELRNNMNAVECRYFTHGFGSSHMWVNQNQKPDRLIFVEF